MPRRRMQGPASVCALVLVILAGPALAGEELRPGDVLSRENWRLADGLMPPEVLRHYQRGEYANPIVRWENGRQRWDRDFVAATQRNAEELTLDAEGAIVERATGRRPAHIRGFPFPGVTAADPRAGIKILWNHYFAWWDNGNIHNYVELTWLSPRGVERRAVQDVYFLYYQGQPREYVPERNPDDLLVQFLATTVRPADLQGTTALAWRYRAPRKRDSVWAYVPVLRRVRAVSPANRSDGFLGSDMSQDDGPFFDGKPEDFAWTVAGERDVLRLTDPFSLAGRQRRVQLSGGGWRGVLEEVPMVGFHDPGWTGVSWAPLSFALARRRCWVIEGVPRDKYYLFGKIQLYIDKETYQGAYNRKFDWQGELVNTYSVFATLNRPDGGHHFGVGSIVYQGEESIKLNRATVAAPPRDQRNPPNDRLVPIGAGFFDASSLVRFGK